MPPSFTRERTAATACWWLRSKTKHKKPARKSRFSFAFVFPRTCAGEKHHNPPPFRRARRRNRPAGRCPLCRRKPSEAVLVGRGGARERVEFSLQAETEPCGLCDDDFSSKRLLHRFTGRRSELFTIRLHRYHDSAIISVYLNTQAKGPPSPMRFFSLLRHTTRKTAVRRSFLLPEKRCALSNGARRYKIMP